MADADDTGTQELVLVGRPASAGIAMAPLALMKPELTPDRIAGTSEEEAEVLEDALAAAANALEALAGSAADDAREILEFQLALIEDDELIDPIVAEIRDGTPAHEAWRAALDREIEAYRTGDDEVFEARAADLEDLRNRVLRALDPTGECVLDITNGPAILAASDLLPSRFIEVDWTRFHGAVLERGSPAGHMAMLARARGIPLVVGLGAAFEELRDGAPAVLDGGTGRLVLDPLPATCAAARQAIAREAALKADAETFRAGPATTASGERVDVAINVDGFAALDDVDPAHVDGIGLVRTEFLFAEGLADEDTQLAAYRRLLAWAGDRPVIVRTLDAGGDKPVAGFSSEGDANPFLGLRGLRLSLTRPDVFRVQLRALARAAPEGRLSVMAPMVSKPHEMATLRALFEDVVAELARAGIPAALPPLGMMVEVPAAALRPEAFPADFYSIGSNDLIQYVCAASRNDPAVADLYDPEEPAVLELIGRVVEAARVRGIEVGLCGDMASDPALVPRLLDLGLRHLSVAPAALGRIKQAIASWPATGPELNTSPRSIG